MDSVILTDSTSIQYKNLFLPFYHPNKKKNPSISIRKILFLCFIIWLVLEKERIQKNLLFLLYLMTYDHVVEQILHFIHNMIISFLFPQIQKKIMNVKNQHVM